MDIRQQIAPKGLEYRASDFIISDKYSTILTVISYPKFIDPGFLSQLTSLSGIKIVIKHILFILNLRLIVLIFILFFVFFCQNIPYYFSCCHKSCNPRHKRNASMDISLDIFFISPEFKTSA